MIKPRKQTYTTDMFLRKMRDRDIRGDADVQRQFVWSNEQVNELIVTVLNDDYIPPIILGEEDSSQLWIVDGGQRSAALTRFRYGNYKISSTIADSMIRYRKKAVDSQNHIITDSDGNIIWEDVSFDVKNKTYDRLPDELKKKFNEYQIETVIHEHCNNHRISRLIQRYNNHTSMNTNQKAFTFLDRFAGEIRDILEGTFVTECSVFTEKERVRGVPERALVETIMCMYHLEHWKKQPKAICRYLNANARKCEFEHLADNMRRLESIITEETKEVFNSKEAFLFLALFDRFAGLGVKDRRFAEFLLEFQNRLRKTERNENRQLFDEIDKDKGTKDKSVIIARLDMLERLMRAFLRI